MPKRYEVEGTNSYLIWAGVLAVLSIWHIIDGWVPQARWMGAPATAQVQWGDGTLEVGTDGMGEDWNGRMIRFQSADRDAAWPAASDVESDGIKSAVPSPLLVTFTEDHGVIVVHFDATTTTLVDMAGAFAAHEKLRFTWDEPVEPETSAADLDGVERELSGGRDGKYPDFPEVWYDMGLYPFYAYNRWTGVLMGIGAIVCVYVHRVVR